MFARWNKPTTGGKLKKKNPFLTHRSKMTQAAPAVPLFHNLCMTAGTLVKYSCKQFSKSIVFFGKGHKPEYFVHENEVSVFACNCIIIILWEQTDGIIQQHAHTHTFQCMCGSCDDIVRPCSPRRSQESDLQMRSSWTSEMKYSSVLIRGRTLTEHSYLQRCRNTAMCGRTEWKLYTHTQTNDCIIIFIFILNYTEAIFKIQSGYFFFPPAPSDVLYQIELVTGCTISSLAFTVAVGVIMRAAEQEPYPTTKVIISQIIIKAPRFMSDWQNGWHNWGMRKQSQNFCVTAKLNLTR